LDTKYIFSIYILIISYKVWEGKDHFELYGIIKVLKCFHTLSGDTILSYLKIARQRKTNKMNLADQMKRSKNVFRMII
jgi:hypothetical protein